MPRPLRILLVLALVLGIGSIATTVGFPSTHRFLTSFFESGIGLSTPEAAAATNVVRKLFHVVVYAVLALLLWWSLPASRWRGRIVLLITLLVGLVDEGIQVLSPGRHGSILDVVVDLTGAGLGLWIATRTGRRAASRRRA